MTEEEMAVDWIRSQGWNEENLPSDELLQMKKAYLAGLKAGKDMAEADLATVAYIQGSERYKPKWHDLRKNPKDLPLKGEGDYITNIGVMTFTSLHDRLIWTTPLCDACDYYEEVTDEVIAWCEIPKYMEE